MSKGLQAIKWRCRLGIHRWSTWVEGKVFGTFENDHDTRPYRRDQRLKRFCLLCGMVDHKTKRVG